jgi:hypothetical protein
MRVHDQDKSNYDLVYMTSFWGEKQFVQTKKKLKEELMVWRIKV